MDALVLLLGLFAHFYNAKMFLASISTELPHSEKVSRRASSKVKPALNEKQLVQRIESGQQLQRADLTTLQAAIKKTKKRITV